LNIFDRMSWRQTGPLPLKSIPCDRAYFQDACRWVAGTPLQGKPELAVLVMTFDREMAFQSRFVPHHYRTGISIANHWRVANQPHAIADWQLIN
jgi:hypothetical protein